MEKHPLTPMTDPDLRRWLGQQTRARRSGTCRSRRCAAMPGAALARLAAEGARLVVADAIDDGDLLRLGRAARGHRLVTGGSGILLGLPANFGIAPGAGSAAFAGRAGPGLVLAGSCSAATLRQVAAYARGHPTLRLAAEDALDTEATLARAIGFHRGEPRGGADGDLERRAGGGRGGAGAARGRAAGGALRGRSSRG